LLGRTRDKGWWYFFPVALSVKTPLPFLFLIGIGAFCLARRAWRARDWVSGVPVVAGVSILVVCLPSRLDIGVRHILPIFVPFALIAAIGAAELWKLSKPKHLGNLIVAVLLIWQLVSSLSAHPDYLAYFNELAGRHPENILVNSDLDWGQDLFRLRTLLRERSVKQVSIAYFGSADLNSFDLPPFEELPPSDEKTGWIAASIASVKMGGTRFPPRSYAWLDAYKPVGRAGRSIWLYYLPPQTHAQAGVVPR
jgi:4-amino-4-deoxy-L-arabinose transferase-like glycosyltransferase